MAATATARPSTRPARKPAPRRAPAPARRRRTGHTPVTGFVPVAAAAGAVGGLADSRMFRWLTRGRLWIGLLGVLLVGIVGLNVLALSFSASSSTAAQAADSLRRQNSAFRAQIAARTSNSEVQAVAARLGLVMPGPGAFNYVRTSPGDAERAAQRLRDRELTLGVAAVAPELATSTTTATTDEAVAVATETPVEPATTDAATTPVSDPAAVAPAATEEAAVAPVESAPPAGGTTADAGAIGAP